VEAGQRLFELNFLVDQKQTDIQSPEFKTEVERALSNVLTDIASKQRSIADLRLPTLRRKRSAVPVPIRVNIKSVEPDEYGYEAGSSKALARVTFTIDGANETLDTNGLGQISPSELNGQLPYEAVSSIITYKQRSPPIHSIISSFAFSIPVGCVILAGCALIIFSAIVAKVAVGDFMKQRRVSGASGYKLDRKISVVGSRVLIPIL